MMPRGVWFAILLLSCYLALLLAMALAPEAMAAPIARGSPMSVLLAASIALFVFQLALVMVFARKSAS